MPYTNILAAVDLGPTTSFILKKAVDLANDKKACISVIHVIEPLTLTYGGDIPMDFSAIQDEIREQAKEQLDEISEKLEIPSQYRYLIIGRPESEILSKAEELGCDLIVLGSHAKWGLALLMGSTTDGVMHSAQCDVLAVKVDIRV